METKELKEFQKECKRLFLVLLMTSLAVISIISILSLNLIFAQEPFQGGQATSFSGATPRLYGASTNPQFNNPSFYNVREFTSPEVYWPKYNQGDCLERQDFVMQIAPGGCSPSVVTSDLLEEQNVPVFCKVMSIKVNPLIDISRVRGLHFVGKDYPPGVASISYFPARAGLSSHTELVSSPVEDNLGYLVVVLKGGLKEDEMPDFVEGNVSATIDYDAEGAFGIGNTNFYVPELNDEDWNRDYKQYGFWNGKGFIRVDALESDGAVVSVYRDQNTREATVSLRKGEKSQDINLGGFYCAAGMNLQLENIQVPVESAQLQINDQQLWVALGDRIPINGKTCRIRRLNVYAGGGSLEVDCNVQNGRFTLSIESGKASLSVNGGEAKEYDVGAKIIDNEGDEGDIFLTYVGEDKDNNPFVVLVKDSFSTTEAQFADKELYPVIDEIITNSWKSLTDEFWTVQHVWQELSLDLNYAIQSAYSKKLSGVSQNEIKKRMQSAVVIPGESNWSIRVDDTSVVKDRNWDSETNSKSLLAKDYYDIAIEDYEDLADIYPNEKRIESEDSYAAQGLSEAFSLAKTFGMNAKGQDLLSRIIDEHENSNIYESALRARQMLTKYDSRESRALIEMNNQIHSFEVLDFKKPSRADASVSLLITSEGKTQEVTLGIKEKEDVTIGGRGENESGEAKRWIIFQLEKLEEEAASLKVVQEGVNLFATGSETKTLKVGESFVFKDVVFKLVDINLKKQVKLKIIPKVFAPRTETGFKFKIGIEKREIQLSPEKTEELIGKLDNLIRDWEEVNEKLGKVVETMKGACFVTSAALTFKNLLDGLGGESLARGEVMTGVGGWNDFCEDLVEDKERSDMTQGIYDNVQKCLLEHNEFIEEDIDKYSKAIQKTNEDLEKIQKNVGTVSSDILDFERQVSGEEVRKKYYEEYFDDYYESHKEEKIKLADGREFVLSDIIPDKTDVSLSDMKNLITFDSLREEKDDSVLNSVLSDELGKDLLYTFEINQENQGSEELKQNLGQFFSDPKVVRLAGDEGVHTEMNTLKESDVENLKKAGVNVEDIKRGTKVVSYRVPSNAYYTQGGGLNFRSPDLVATKKDILEQPVSAIVREGSKVVPTYNWPDKNINLMGPLQGKDVVVVLKPDGREYVPSQAYYYEENSKTLKKLENEKEFFGYLAEKGADKFAEVNQKAYENKMSESQKVKYFEREPYKGLPAEVPFDKENGWYTEMTYVLSGFGRPYDESTRVVNFWICNVGENGRIQFKQSADDICRYYNGNTGADLGFPGMSEGTSRALVQKAQQAIAEAGRQYGKDKVKIGKDVFEAGISFGGEEGRCSDFMSPQDCHIIFNICDPVICPTSRCDADGKFPVDNVIQTGIIGSLFLCLPNAKEGIAVPICLSGVHAGIEGYLSILKGGQACLRESLESGRNIGFCDTITSIYLCKLFWKEASPFLSVIIPRTFESLFSQGVRGGGEYSTVQTAWDNTQKAVDYFKNEYAVNSLEAFNLRSTEEIGDEVCGSFMSVRYPDSADWFDNLIEPDSPVQFHAWFSEDVLTTATIPSTSHYKVTYHIYAGKDQGVYYTVYLKDLPETSYIHSSQMRVVPEAQGYLPRGGSITMSPDFTAVSGYKQLCVSINGKEECGFKQVSTSYFLDTLTDGYAAEQAEAGDIKTEEECVAGTPSLKTMFQPNLQSGFEEVLNPELYNHGIIRVCASENPGKQVNPSGEYVTGVSISDRWKPIGYCGDPTIECWLDQDSVKDVIKDKGLEQEVLDQTNLNAIGEIDFLTQSESQTYNTWAENDIDNLVIPAYYSEEEIITRVSSILDKLDRVINAGATNRDRARAMLLMARLYNKVASLILPPPALVTEEEGEEEEEEAEAEVKVKEEETYSTLKEAVNKLEQAIEEGRVSGYKEFIPEKEVYFKFQDGTVTSDISYSYKEHEEIEGYYSWYWAGTTSVDKDLEWISVDIAEQADDENYNLGADPVPRNVRFIRSLRGKSFADGVELLAERVKADEEGGWFANPDLELYANGRFIMRFFDYFREDLDLNAEGILEIVFRDNVAGKKEITNLDVKKYYDGFFKDPETLEIPETAEETIPEKEVYFLFQDGDGWNFDLYYAYLEHEEIEGYYSWYWGYIPVKDIKWITVNIAESADSDEYTENEDPSPENVVFIRKFRGKNFADGVKLLADRARENNEKGFFAWASPEIELYIDHKLYETYSSNYFSLKDSDEFVNEIFKQAGEKKIVNKQFKQSVEDVGSTESAEAVLGFIENVLGFRETIDVDALKDEELKEGVSMRFVYYTREGLSTSIGMIGTFEYNNGWNYDIADEPMVLQVPDFINELRDYRYKDGVQFLLTSNNFPEGFVEISKQTVVRRDLGGVNEEVDIQGVLRALKK